MLYYVLCLPYLLYTCKVRVYVYTAHGLRTKASGEKPQPFLKVFNGLTEQQTRTTRDRPVGSTLSPEFHASFELSAYLPGESQLHVQVRDHSARTMCVCVCVCVCVCIHTHAHAHAHAHVHVHAHAHAHV